MRVFISWSGESSKAAALAVSEFLAQPWGTSVKPFVSDADIEAGARWQDDIVSELDKSNFGVICVTRENQDSPWLNFEAGAIAKRVTESRCVPLALDLTPAQIKRPLGMFQAKKADEAGFKALVLALNGAVEEEHRRTEPQLAAQFEAFFPALSEAIEAAQNLQPATEQPRSDREILEEVLGTVREIARRDRTEAQVARVFPNQDSGSSLDVLSDLVLLKVRRSLQAETGLTARDYTLEHNDSMLTLSVPRTAISETELDQAVGRLVEVLNIPVRVKRT